MNPYEDALIRKQFEEYHKALRVAKDLKKTRDSPVDLKFFDIRLSL